MKNCYLIGLLLSFTVFTTAQDAHRWCSQDLLMNYFEEHKDDPDFIYKDLNRLQNPECSGTSASDSVITVQVVVHVVYVNDNKYENVPDELIHSQIDALNRDFNAMNPVDKTRPVFQDRIGNPAIRFQLATTKPNGQPTNGIVRKKGNPIIFNAWLPVIENVKTSFLGGSNSWNTSEYLNIWVCDLNLGSDLSQGVLGGYAYPPAGTPNWPPGTTPAPRNDGAVIDFRFFGQNNDFINEIEPRFSYNNKGRTTVHEIGHYFGLRHIWGDLGTLFPDLGCNSDDGIQDTPNAASPSRGESGPICLEGDPDVNSCGSGTADLPDMWENYMDYSSDTCYNMFTTEQACFMRYILLNKREGIILTETATGITRNDLLDASLVNVYPNPSNGLFYLDQNLNTERDFTIRIYNSVGEMIFNEVKSGLAKNHVLDLERQSPGVYLMSIATEDGVLTKSLMIE